MLDGYVKLHRKLIDWEWYSDVNVKVVFLHCLLMANHDEIKWRGKTIGRGTFLTSYEKLANELHLSVKAIRIALDKLKMTGEVAVIGAREGTTINIVKYEDYQVLDISKGKIKGIKEDLITTIKGQERGKKGATNKNEKNIKTLNTYRSIVNSFSENLELRKALDSFVEMRMKMKGFTTNALELALQTLNSLANDELLKIKIVNQSIEKGWKTFYPLSQSKPKQGARKDELPDYYEAEKQGVTVQADTDVSLNKDDLEELRRKIREQEGKR